MKRNVIGQSATKKLTAGFSEQKLMNGQEQGDLMGRIFAYCVIVYFG
jgi:hypothetical protein